MDFDFMEYIKELSEQIEQSVRDGQKEISFVLLARLLFYIDELYGEKMIDKRLYNKTLEFYGNMHRLLLAVETI